LLYGITPPKIHTPAEKILEIAARQRERLDGTGIDGLVLYDIQDESSRNRAPRPFPFMETLNPYEYTETYLSELKVPKIIYNSIGKYTSDSFAGWIGRHRNKVEYMVLVGAPSGHATGFSLQDAYRLRSSLCETMLLGGVTIPERHVLKGDEHLRVCQKIDNGCSFFISQCVYNVTNSKNFLSDYYFNALESGRALVPVIFTITPCGSPKTLQFMEWLGIEIPLWLKNELSGSRDMLSKSVEACKEIVDELYEFASAKGIPTGFNIESVAIRRDEIEASVELLHYARKKLKGY